MNRTLSVFVFVAALFVVFAVLPNQAHAWCTPQDLVCGSEVISSTAGGHTDINHYSCTGSMTFNNRAKVYRIHHPGGRFWATLDWTGSVPRHELWIFILTSCDQNHCIAANQHYIQMDLNSGDYWIIVDGLQDHATDFTLRLFCGDHPEPVELTSFDASSRSDGVRLTWTVASELNNQAFIVDRQQEGSDQTERVAYLDGRGTDASAFTYSFTDVTAQPSVSYTYHLSALDLTGAREEVGTVTATWSAPAQPVSNDYQLVGNYPNPFNPTTTIRFSVSEATRLNLAVYDVSGRLVRTLANEVFAAGSHDVGFDASGLPSGLYFARLSGGTHTDLMKMALIK